MKASTVDVEITINANKHQHPRPRRTGGTEAPTATRIPRITRLMGLAIKFQDMVDRGEVRDYADLARLGYVSRARITQIMNLLNLSPDIQETLLFEVGCDGTPSTERDLRKLGNLVFWEAQREAWRSR